MHLAMVAAVDDSVGLLPDQLKQQGLENDTVIWFQADNGATREQRASSDGKPYHGGSNGRYRGYKLGLFDGGMHVPAILRAPGFLKPGEVWDRPLISMDLLPTFLAMADPRGKAAEGTDGQNILPVMRGEKPAQEVLFWSHGNQRAVRQADWKLIVNPPNFPGEPVADKFWLSNLEADPSEKKNLAAQEPGRVKELVEKLKAWERDVKIAQVE